MTTRSRACVEGLCLLALLALASVARAEVPAAQGYDSLLQLFQEWRQFEEPEFHNGVPDYSATAMARKLQGLGGMRQRLSSIDPAAWPVSQQVDHRLVRAEMNGLEFRLRVLKPWARDPSFYASVLDSQSDTPSEEGPTIHGAIRLWMYPVWPRTSLSVTRALTPAEEAKLAAQLRTVPPLLKQARVNLAESQARDLWVGGVRTLRQQSKTLDELAGRLGSPGKELGGAVQAAKKATDEFADWLEREAPSRQGPSGIGKAHYTWHLRNVLLVPRAWEDEYTMMRQELARAHASLQLEEVRNRGLPPLNPVESAEAFANLQQASITSYLDFLRRSQLIDVEDYYDVALRERTFSFHPEATRHLFHQATHRDPTTLWTHLFHYWDLARMDQSPHASPIRRKPLLFNIWMSRSEGLTTGFEEWSMHAGLYDASPRSREIVWVLLAARAARGMATLQAHAGTMDMQQASRFHVEWTPRGWMRADQDLLGFEQLLYMRQPGYGTSYITGARLIEEIMASRARALGDRFDTRAFFAQLLDSGLIPVSMIGWEMTGDAAFAGNLGLEPLM